ncbi:LTA synthase family protein [Ureibacillus acetophenoni]|nr:LTA synthase family protein [Ureibacillus acetophenoni]
MKSERVKFILYVIIDLIVSILLLAVILYKNYYGYIATVYAFGLINQVGTVQESVLSLFNPIYLLLFIDFLLLIVFVFVKKRFSQLNDGNKSIKFILGTIIVGIALISTNLLMHKGEQIADSVIAAEKQGIFNYQVFAVINKNANQNSLTPDELAMLPDSIADLKEVSVIPEEQLKFAGIAEGKNVISVQVEALQDFTIGLEIDGQEVTPYLNELLKDSIYFPNVYQQIGPGNTSDAEFIFNTSLYPNAWTATSESFSDRAIPSLPKLLNKLGYTSFTAHANDVSFWNRENLYPALGFDKYYDIKFFGQEDVISIGPSDEVLYSKLVPELKKMHEQGQNFYGQFVTLSSHHPFKIPDTKEVITLPSKFDGSIVGNYLKSVNYADFALGKFVQDLKDEGMWEDTILIVYGDHFGLHPTSVTENDISLLNDLIGHEYHYHDQFNIPFIVAVGDQSYGEIINTIGGQIDILPTVANMLNLSLDNFVHFGQDLVNHPDNLLGMRYYMPIGSFFNNEISFKPKEEFEDGDAYDVYTNGRIRDYSAFEEDYDRILKLMKYSDLYMNSLPKREHSEMLERN